MINLPEIADTISDPSTDPGWNVIVWNDDVNVFEYVIYVFQKVLEMSREQAEKATMRIHETGRDIVWHGSTRERAEAITGSLHGWMIWATFEKATSQGG